MQCLVPCVIGCMCVCLCQRHNTTNSLYLLLGNKMYLILSNNIFAKISEIVETLSDGCQTKIWLTSLDVARILIINVTFA